METTSKIGVTWKFLETLHEYYRVMMHRYSVFLMTGDNKYVDPDGNVIYKDTAYKKLQASYALFFISVRSSFSNYMDKHFEKVFDKNEYVTTLQDFDDILRDFRGEKMDGVHEAIEALGHWATTNGPFATLVETKSFNSYNDVTDDEKF